MTIIFGRKAALTPAAEPSGFPVAILGETSLLPPPSPGLFLLITGCVCVCVSLQRPGKASWITEPRALETEAQPRALICALLLFLYDWERLLPY